MQYDFQALNDIFASVPDHAARTAAEWILSHRRIFVYGAGRSGLMLKALAMRLSQMGRTVYVVGETVTPAIEKNDLLILASASGKTQSVLQYAKTANTIGADLYVITASNDCPLLEYKGQSTLMPAPTKFSGGSAMMGTLFEQGLLLFCDLIVEKMNTDVNEMRLRHANLE